MLQETLTRCKYLGNIKTNIRRLDKKEKGPEAKIKKTLEVSKDVLEKIPDLPDVMDKANIALQMLAEGKLNIYTNSGKNIELEELKMKNERNNIIIIILGVVIGAFVVF